MMPRCLGTSQSVPREEQAVVGVVRARAPQLLSVHDPLVAVALGARGQAREVGATSRLAEQLAPRVLTGDGRPRGTAASRRPNRARAASVPRARTRHRTAGPTAPASAISCATISSAHGGSPRPCQSGGHDGHAQPAPTNRLRHSTSDSAGSHCSASQPRTSARTASGVAATAGQPRPQPNRLTVALTGRAGRCHDPRREPTRTVPEHWSSRHRGGSRPARFRCPRSATTTRCCASKRAGCAAPTTRSSPVSSSRATRSCPATRRSASSNR